MTKSIFFFMQNVLFTEKILLYPPKHISAHSDKGRRGGRAGQHRPPPCCAGRPQGGVQPAAQEERGHDGREQGGLDPFACRLQRWVPVLHSGGSIINSGGLVGQLDHPLEFLAMHLPSGALGR